MGRKRVLANGGLLEVHLGACQQAVVDFMFAAIPVIGEAGLNFWIGPSKDAGFLGDRPLNSRDQRRRRRRWRAPNTRLTGSI